MNRVYILMNYNYYSIKGYKEDRELAFDDPDILYDGIHHGAFFDIEALRRSLLRRTTRIFLKYKEDYRW